MKPDDETYASQNTFDDQQIKVNIRAPLSLQEGLLSRIELYKQHSSTSLSYDKLCLAMQDERWEVRSAAVEGILGKSNQKSLEFLERALQDSNPYVRMAALRSLDKLDLVEIKPLLYVGLQDSNYQVREMAVFMLASLKGQAGIELLTNALEDEDHDVREAAGEVLLQIEAQRKREMTSHTSSVLLLPSLPGSHTKREGAAMSSKQSILEMDKKRTHMALLYPQKFSRKISPVVLAGALVLVLGILTAAGFGWWNYSFGTPDLYTLVNQQQSHQGITVRVTKVYADQGRTIIAYDLSSKVSTKQYTLNNFDLVGSVPQQQEALSGSYEDRPEQGIQHVFMVEPPFLVPAKVDTLTLTLNIGEVIVTEPGKPATSTVSGPWHFVFTISFHHENNKHIANPIHGNVYINQ